MRKQEGEKRRERPSRGGEGRENKGTGDGRAREKGRMQSKGGGAEKGKDASVGGMRGGTEGRNEREGGKHF